ncbi:hypothetical protein WKR88_24845 [Trinickia caryophylli]|uniref:hypothetical protein n=1 Tax=Trinickia caryophylli TaxID=28094 RepID=UPI001E5F6560|nr:hypothetical protein [Trinickia caryophylli]WQE14142.1 hypothetical protein U0034_25960 [Trinickia caryophylli]
MLVMVDSVGHRIARAIKKVVLALDLQMALAANEVRLQAIGDVARVPAEQQYRRQADDHREQRTGRATPVTKQVSESDR